MCRNFRNGQQKKAVEWKKTLEKMQGEGTDIETHRHAQTQMLTSQLRD